MSMLSQRIVSQQKVGSKNWIPKKNPLKTAFQLVIYEKRYTTNNKLDFSVEYDSISAK